MHKQFMTAALAAAVLMTAPPSFAGEEHKDKTTMESRYELTTDAGDLLLFPEPVSFTGEVIAQDNPLDLAKNGQVRLRAENGTEILIPRMATVWNGDRNIFAQDADLGDEVVVHLRLDEPYRIISNDDQMVTIGSYDGVFWMPKEFVMAIDIGNLDDDIYAETDEEDRNEVAEYYDQDIGRDVVDR